MENLRQLATLLAVFGLIIVARGGDRRMVSSFSKGRSLDLAAADCEELPEQVLGLILGAAFNARYMSIDTPREFLPDEIGKVEGKEGNEDVLKSIKRGTSHSSQPFYVDESFVHEISQAPAWDVNHSLMQPTEEEEENEEDHLEIEEEVDLIGGKRSVMDFSRRRNQNREKSDENSAKPPWECDSRLGWIDLGPEYFPRYLRSVECLSKTCHYAQYQCIPKSFTVKVLRKRTGQCIRPSALNEVLIGTERGRLQVWVWEERAINFCCECGLAKRRRY